MCFALSELGDSFVALSRNGDPATVKSVGEFRDVATRLDGTIRRAMVRARRMQSCVRACVR